MHIHVCTVYREIFAPVLFSLLSPLLSAGEFKTGQIQMSQIISFIHKYVWINSRWGKPFASEKGQKNHGAKIPCIQSFNSLIKNFNI